MLNVYTFMSYTLLSAEERFNEYICNKRNRDNWRVEEEERHCSKAKTTLGEPARKRAIPEVKVLVLVGRG
jgi:hypothetical protein